MSYYEIDWDSDTSLHNWMTDLDFICAEPYSIGLIGAMSFISFSIGSILLTNLMDTHGRKKVLVVSSLITPLGMICMMLFAKNLVTIYVFIFLIGLTYNTRSSTAYLYGTEFL